MIVSTPLDFPKLVPDDWDKWNAIWDEHAKPLTKKRPSPNKAAGLHVGFDMFREGWFEPVYDAPHVYMDKIYPSFMQQIMALPVKIYCVRAVMSLGDFRPHVDNFSPSWIIRSLLQDTSPTPQWYYTDMKNENVKYQTLPEETNWWAYHDGIVKHGTTYNEDHKKILIQVFSKIDETQKFIDDQLASSKYKDFQISYDSPEGV